MAFNVPIGRIGLVRRRSGCLDIAPSYLPTRNRSGKRVKVHPELMGQMSNRRRCPQRDWVHLPGQLLAILRHRVILRLRVIDGSADLISGKFCVRVRFRGRIWSVSIGRDRCQRGSDLYLGPRLNQQFGNRSVLEYLDFYGRLCRVYYRDDITAVDSVSGLDEPLHDSPGLHICAQGGHREHAHGSTAPVQRDISGG
ncbi:MAG: hypothetical protein U9Q71_04960 [Pseudomonadota bacterium]|nr:hypothetical protein [Pseudomonadota bacterium]